MAETLTVPFLTYKLLTPETADPVIMRITGQRERGFPKLICDNGIAIISKSNPEYDAPFLFVWGEDESDDADLVYIPLADWPAVKQAITELNEAKREVPKGTYKKARGVFAEQSGGELPEETIARMRSTDMKEDKYGHKLNEHKFDLKEWHWESWGLGTGITLTRKKPRVKVEWGNCSRFGDGLGENGIDFSSHGYGKYHLVQFRVTGFAWNEYLEWIRCDGHLAEVSILLTRQRTVSSFNPSHCENQRHFLYIGLDARDKWSAPVLLPESIFSRLNEITKALEDRANGGKG